MQILATDIDGVFVVQPKIWPDERGQFSEIYRLDVLKLSLPVVPEWKQINSSTSFHGVIRGLHYTKEDAGQYKYVSCVSGRIRDFVVDLRVGSPSFKQHISIELDDREKRAVFIPPGVAHGFAVESDVAQVNYLVSEYYSPSHEFTLNPLDPDINLDYSGIPQPFVLSEKDRAGASFAELLGGGSLPRFRDN